MLRTASLKDTDQILELCNAHESRVDSDVEPMSRADVELNIKGVGEPGHTIVWDEAGQPSFVGALHLGLRQRFGGLKK